jgi:hypothetical protein
VRPAAYQFNGIFRVRRPENQGANWSGPERADGSAVLSDAYPGGQDMLYTRVYGEDVAGCTGEVAK